MFGRFCRSGRRDNVFCSHLTWKRQAVLDGGRTKAIVGRHSQQCWTSNTLTFGRFGRNTTNRVFTHASLKTVNGWTTSSSELSASDIPLLLND